MGVFHFFVLTEIWSCIPLPIMVPKRCAIYTRADRELVGNLPFLLIEFQSFISPPLRVPN